MRQPHRREAESPANGILDFLFSERAKSIMIFIVAMVALGFALYHTRPVLAPIMLALVVGIVVSPVAERLNVLGIPRVVSASALLLIATALLVVAFIAIEPLLTSLAAQLPRIRFEIQSWIDWFSSFLQGIETLSNEIEETVGGDATAPAAAEDAGPDIPSVMDAVWLAPNFGAKVFIFIGTLFFFVMSRSELYAAAGPMCESLKRADRAVARYFAAVTTVNIALGAVTALAMTLLGLENPLLWGLAAGTLNYILYLGPLITAFCLLIAGLMQFSGLSVLLPPLVFLAINMTEAQFVTPAFVGQRLELSPLGVFLAVVFGLWLWGPIGAIIALPVALWVGVLLKPPAPRVRHASAPTRL